MTFWYSGYRDEIMLALISRNGEVDGGRVWVQSEE